MLETIIKKLKMSLPDIQDILIPSTSYRFDQFIASPVFIDKSLFIQRVLNEAGNYLITRPRRWGKSLNLDMLRRFLELEVDEKGNPLKENSNSKYFLDNDLRRLKINNVLSPDIQSHQGKYPVISLSFVNVTVLKRGENEYDQARAGIKKAIQNVFIEKSYLKPWLEQNGSMDETTLKLFCQMLNGEADEDDLIDSLRFLAKLLKRYHHNDVFVLIDEYDKCVNRLIQDETLVQENNERLCEEISKTAKLISSIILVSAKDCLAIKQIIITGIFNTLIAEGGDSCLNNIRKCDLEDTTFSEFFGLSEQEIKEQVLNTAFAKDAEPEQLARIKQDLKTWYNGYVLPAGAKSIEAYNPYSIMNYTKTAVREKMIPEKILPVWNESGTSIFLANLAQIKLEDKLFTKLLGLAQGSEVSLEYNQDFRLMDHFKKRNWINAERAISYLLFHSGYITKVKDNPSYYKVPNAEVLYYFGINVISAYIQKKTGSPEPFGVNELSSEFGPSLTDVKAFQNALGNFLANLPNEGEKNEPYFNALVAGGIMFYSISQQATHYVSVEVHTTDSTGDIGFIDNIFYPYLEREKDKEKIVIIHEYKVVRKTCSKLIEEANEEGLWQILIKNYLDHPLQKFQYLQNSLKAIEARSVTIYFDEESKKWGVEIKSKRYTMEQAAEIVKFFSKQASLKAAYKEKAKKKAYYELQKNQLLMKYGYQSLDELLESLTKNKQALIPEDIILEGQKENNEIQNNLSKKHVRTNHKKTNPQGDIILEEPKENNTIQSSLKEQSVKVNTKKIKLTDQAKLEKEILNKKVKIERSQIHLLVKKEDKIETEELSKTTRRSTRKRKAVSYKF